MKTIQMGVLSFHGDVIEHILATIEASKRTRIPVDIVEVRTKNQISSLHGLILPGGESTTLHKLCVREHMWEDMKKIPALFGTCAGAILMSKTIRHKTADQQSLGRININIDRNAYGRQTDSFEKIIETSLGKINTVFIRAPRIVSAGKHVKILAQNEDGILACEETDGKTYSLAACFHPELTTSVFHEYFLKTVTTLV